MPRSLWFKIFVVLAALWAPFSQADTGWQPVQETIRKSEKDTRQYQAIRLDNDMVVLLVSDPQAVKSLSALVVPVGSLQDPADHQGLAHFLEHMTLMGSQKYPQPDSLAEFLKLHGGSHNASTAPYRTAFYLEVENNALDGAVDRLADAIAAPLLIQGVYTAKEKDKIQKKVLEMMDVVGLARRLINSYPHELDGGRRQRIGIARALALNPKFIVCDEPVSALDVSIQAQILNLLKNLQKELDLTSIFIGHGLGAVNYVSDRIAVMYLGQIVELADSRELFDHPLHPYSKALFDAVPLADPRTRKRLGGGVIEGEAEILPGPGEGCPFYPRCPRRSRECSAAKMELRPASEGSSHLVSCIHAGQEGVD